MTAVVCWTRRCAPFSCRQSQAADFRYTLNGRGNELRRRAFDGTFPCEHAAGGEESAVAPAGLAGRVPDPFSLATEAPANAGGGNRPHPHNLRARGLR